MMHRILAMLPGQISCKQFEERLDDYMEGELSLVGRFRMGVHIIICGACSAYAAAYTKTLAAVKRTFKDDQGSDDTVPEDLVEQILKDHHGHRH